MVKGSTKTSGSLKWNNCGFTIIEILMAVMIGALLFGVSINAMRSRFDSEGRRLMQRLQGTIKYYYNTAATSSDTYRLVFNLEEQVVSVEMAEGGYVRPVTSPETGAKPEEEETPASADTPEAAEGEEPLTLVSPTDITFGPVTGPAGLVKPVKMPRKVTLLEVRVVGNPAPIKEGKAYVHCYPGGYVDQASLIFTNETQDEFFVLTTNSVTGLSRVTREYPEDES